MAGKSRNWDDMPRFWGLEQAPPVFPLRDAGEARRPRGAWRCRADREAGPQRSLPVRLGAPVSSAAACRADATTAHRATTSFRPREWAVAEGRPAAVFCGCCARGRSH